MNGLKWFASILLVFTGVVGVGMSLCGGVILISADSRSIKQVLLGLGLGAIGVWLIRWADLRFKNLKKKGNSTQ